jgi:hypothetical protein
MPDIDKATGRVIALIVLLVLVAASLHGYLPAAGRASREQQTGSPAALAVVAVLLGVSLAIVAVAIIARVRNRRPVASSIGALSAGLGGGKGRPSWRVLLILLVAISAWLLITWLLYRSVGQHGSDQLVLGGHTDTPATGAASPATEPAPQPKRPPRNSGGNMFGYLTVAAVGMLLLTITSAVATARIRRRSPEPPMIADERPAAPVARSDFLARAAELGLAEIGDLSREPREAIIGCYATMERELAHVPDAVPQDFDTPTEVLTRAVAHHALSADNAIQLVNLFAEARFSQHLMTEAHREDAIRILRLVLDELRVPT